MGLNLSTSLLDISGVGVRFFPKLKKLGIYTVGDLIRHFPHRYEDYSKIYKVNDLEPEQFATVQGVIESIDVHRSWRRNMTIVEAFIADDTGSIRAVWFNQPYIQSSLPQGKLVNVSGKISLSDESDLYFNNPSVETIRKDTKHTARIVPIYPETRGLTSKGLRFLMQGVLKNTHLDEWIPFDILKNYKIPEINLAFKDVHFPRELDDAFVAKNRFAFEDLLLLQLAHFEEKNLIAMEKGHSIETDIEWLKHAIAALPFNLTEAQKKSLWDIVKDFAKPHPMNRLLQGDVGSGKTAVAALAALIAAKHGFQTAFMAPTEVLARQHFETLKKLFRGVHATDQPVIGLLTGSEARIFYETDLESSTNKASLVAELKKGKIGIIVGTHALISPVKSDKTSDHGAGTSQIANRKSKTAKTNSQIAFHNLGFVVVDEQHRFGVAQRKALLHSHERSASPHFLSMSATPIPRTLMMTVFGDLDISLITELPAGRKHIETRIVSPYERTTTYTFIREKIREGRQAFVICPRIEANSESQIADSKLQNAVEIKSVKEEYEKLSKTVFPDLRVGMLHGQMKPKEKAEIMKKFITHSIDILVSTSVVEVGVDVPNAVIMMIEGSERFGLAQLYQFRGRVGRGEHQSYCFLFTDSTSQGTKSRLKAMLTAKNGFELAEYDLKLRGPGQFLGTEQTGIPDIAMENLQNMFLVTASRDAAQNLLAQDSQLLKHSGVKERLAEFKKRIHRE